MGIYPALHRLGSRPWERYARVQGADVGAQLDRERAAAGEPVGRALDLGCGRGMHTPKLAERGWEPVGVDLCLQTLGRGQREAAGRSITAREPWRPAAAAHLREGVVQLRGARPR